MPVYLSLAIAILAEVASTLALKTSDGFTKVVPSLVAICGYGVAFYFLAITLRTIHVGVAYAIWSGVGIVLISVIGWFAFGQKLDTAAMLGLALIVAGVLVVNLFSKSMAN